VEVTVSKTSSNVSVTGRAQWGFLDFGEFYGRYLEIVPQTHNDRIALMHDSRRLPGPMSMPEPQGQKPSRRQVQKLNGENVGLPFQSSLASADAGHAPSAREHAAIEDNFTNRIAMEHRIPNLYQVLVSIKDQKGIIHQ